MIPIRFDEATVTRIDAMAAWLEAQTPGTSFTRADAARVCMLSGLATHEAAEKASEKLTKRARAK